jgi:uncharacterized membrane protein
MILARENPLSTCQQTASPCARRECGSKQLTNTTLTGIFFHVFRKKVMFFKKHDKQSNTLAFSTHTLAIFTHTLSFCLVVVENVRVWVKFLREIIKFAQFCRILLKRRFSAILMEID